MRKTNILRKIIKAKHDINNLIFDEFLNYCKNHNIKQQCFYSKENKQKLNNTIFDFIITNLKEWEKNPNDKNANDVNNYITKYLTNIYDLDTLPF